MDYGQISEQLGNFKTFVEAIGGIFMELPKFIVNLGGFINGGGSSALEQTSSLLGSSEN